MSPHTSIEALPHRSNFDGSYSTCRYNLHDARYAQLLPHKVQVQVGRSAVGSVIPTIQRNMMRSGRTQAGIIEAFVTLLCDLLEDECVAMIALKNLPRETCPSVSITYAAHLRPTSELDLPARHSYVRDAIDKYVDAVEHLNARA